MSEEQQLTKPQKDREHFLIGHNFKRVPNDSIKMEGPNGKVCLVDARGMIFWLWTDKEIKGE